MIEILCTAKAFEALNKITLPHGTRLRKVILSDTTNELTFVDRAPAPVLVGGLGWGTEDVSKLTLHLASTPLYCGMDRAPIADFSEMSAKDLESWIVQCLAEMVRGTRSELMRREREIARIRIALEDARLTNEVFGGLTWFDLNSQKRQPAIQIAPAQDCGVVSIGSGQLTQLLPLLEPGFIAIKLWIAENVSEWEGLRATLFLPEEEREIALDGPIFSVDENSVQFHSEYALKNYLSDGEIRIGFSGDNASVPALCLAGSVPSERVWAKVVGAKTEDTARPCDAPLAMAIYVAPAGMRYAASDGNTPHLMTLEDEHVAWEHLRETRLVTPKDPALLAVDDPRRLVIVHPMPTGVTIAKLQGVVVDAARHGQARIQFCLANAESHPVEVACAIVAESLLAQPESIEKTFENWTRLAAEETAALKVDVPKSGEPQIVVVASRMHKNDTDNRFAWASFSSLAFRPRDAS